MTRKYPLPVLGGDIMQQDPGTLGKRLRYARKQQRLTQAQLAELSGYSQKAITKIERDMVCQPEWERLQALAKALGVKPAWLQYGKAVLDDLDELALDIAAMSMELPPEKRKAFRDQMRLLVGPETARRILPNRDD